MVDIGAGGSVGREGETVVALEFDGYNVMNSQMRTTDGFGQT